MGAGGPGDHPLTDLVVHGIKRFPEDMCIILIAIHSYDRNLLGKFELDFSAWAEGNRLDEGRMALASIIDKNQIGPALVGGQKEHLKQSRSLYTEALMHKELKNVYFSLSQQLLFAAEAKGDIPDSYNKQKAVLNKFCQDSVINKILKWIKK